MSVKSRPALLPIAAAVAISAAAGASTLALAQKFSPWEDSPLMRGFGDNWSSGAGPQTLGQLASNEGIYVDMKGFKIAKGAAQGNPSALIEKMAAKKVSDGAIIFRSGDALYIVDGMPKAKTQ
jgi:hypothetical protein